MFNLRRVAVPLIVVLFFGGVTAVFAQTPRPTPTNVSPTSPPNEDGGDTTLRGTMQGQVYLDVNGDGVCVNSGVEGEVAVAGIPVEFVSSDEATIITVTSGEDGGFGLFAAGQSYWRVTAKPETGWVVTSENPLYVPVYPETLSHVGVDFCVAEGTAANGVVVLSSGQTFVATGSAAEGTILLPEAGGNPELGLASGVGVELDMGILVGITAVFGLFLFMFGVVLHRRQNSS